MHIARDGGRERLVKVMNGNSLPTPRLFEDKVWQDSYIDDFGLFAEAKWSIDSKTLLTAGLRNDIVVSDIRESRGRF
jgi:iron complex outermembrane receptor protein